MLSWIERMQHTAIPLDEVLYWLCHVNMQAATMSEDHDPVLKGYFESILKYGEEIPAYMNMSLTKVHCYADVRTLKFFIMASIAREFQLGWHSKGVHASYIINAVDRMLRDVTQIPFTQEKARLLYLLNEYLGDL